MADTEQLRIAINKFVDETVPRARLIVEGDANTVVPTDSGQTPSFAKAIFDFQNNGQSAVSNFVSNSGSAITSFTTNSENAISTFNIEGGLAIQAQVDRVTDAFSAVGFGFETEKIDFQAGLEQTAGHSQLDFDSNPDLVLNAGDGDERHKVVRYILNSKQFGVGVVPYPDGDEAGATGADIPVDLISLFGPHRHFFVKVSIYGGTNVNAGAIRTWFREIYLSARFNSGGPLIDLDANETTSIDGSFHNGPNSVDVNVTEVNDKVNFNISTGGNGGDISTMSIELISKINF